MKQKIRDEWHRRLYIVVVGIGCTMIISNIIGGLGNQMFQFANGKACANRLNVELKLDISDFSEYVLHNGFELYNVFDLNESLATIHDLKKVIGWRAVQKIKSLLCQDRFKSFRGDHFVVEPNKQYYEGIQNLPKPVYLKGYWQNEKYFIDIERDIRADFVFKPPLDHRNLRFLADIEQAQSVAMHIRRGDYVNNKTSLKIHGVCSPGYYKTAMDTIAQKVKDPLFFVFSDDFDWVSKNIVIPYAHTYIEGNSGVQAYKDLHLMSVCKHHIIANSSFSWWGAWLSKNDQKIVIAPTPWFEDMHFLCTEILPDKWITLPKNLC